MKIIEPGVIVVCINSSKQDSYQTNIIDSFIESHESLTIGKQYRVEYNGLYYISIINDNGINSPYNLKRFVTIDEWREKQLNKLIGL